MLYNLQGEQKPFATETNIFGTRCFLTLGVEIMGKTLEATMIPWQSIEELVEYKNLMNLCFHLQHQRHQYMKKAILYTYPATVIKDGVPILPS